MNCVLSNRKTICILLLILILLNVFITPASSQSSEEISLSFTADKDEVTVGELVTLTLTISCPAGCQVTTPKPEKTWGDFEVRSATQPRITKDDAYETTQIDYIVTLFSPGVFETPPASVTITNQQGEAVEKSIPPVSVMVKSVLTPEDTTIRDLKPQANIPEPSPIPWILAALALIAVLIWLTRRYFPGLFHKKASVNSVSEEDLRPASEIALQELLRIESLRLLSKGEYKQLHSLVADCLRGYLERLLSINVLERTTFELKSALKQTNLSQEYAAQFISLFTECDLVKFAKYVPDIQKSENLIPYARQLIEMTAPQPVINREDTPKRNEA